MPPSSAISARQPLVHSTASNCPLRRSPIGNDSFLRSGPDGPSSSLTAPESGPQAHNPLTGVRAPSAVLADDLKLAVRRGSPEQPTATFYSRRTTPSLLDESRLTARQSKIKLTPDAHFLLKHLPHLTGYKPINVDVVEMDPSFREGTLLCFYEFSYAF